MNDINNQLETELNDVSDRLDLPRGGRFNFREIPSKVGETARSAANHANSCVHNHTWTTMAVAMGVGLAIGVLAGRRG